MTETGQPPRRVVLTARGQWTCQALLDLLDANTPFVVAGLVDDFPCIENDACADSRSSVPAMT